MTISIMVCWLNHQVFSAAMQLGDPCDGRVIMRWNSFLKMSIYMYQLYRVLSVHDETSTETLSERKRFLLLHSVSYFSQWIPRQMKAPQRLSEMVRKHVWLGSVSLQLKFGSKLRISSDSPPAKQRGHCLAIATWDMDAMWNDVRDQVMSWKMAKYGRIWQDGK